MLFHCVLYNALMQIYSTREDKNMETKYPDLSLIKTPNVYTIKFPNDSGFQHAP